MKLAAAVLVALAACDTVADPDDVPAPEDLYGSWIMTSLPGETHVVDFSPTAPSGHPELAGRDDVFVYQINGVIEGTGEFTSVAVPPAGREDGQPLGLLSLDVIEGDVNNFGSYITGWTGDTYTLYKEIVDEGDTVSELVYVRQ